MNNSAPDSIRKLAYKVKERTITQDEIAILVDYTKEHGGIEYAEKRMEEMRREAMEFIELRLLTTRFAAVSRPI